MTELRFDNEVAIVTGSGRGIGRSHALLLASRGARVVVADIGADIDGQGGSDGPAKDVVREIEDNGGRAVACVASVAESDGATTLVEAALSAFGGLHIVVNNAGIYWEAPFAEVSLEQVRRMQAVHYFGTLNVIRAAWPHFVGAGYGRIVNTVSAGMLGAMPNLSHYGAAKGAVFGLTRNLAFEGEALGIKANAISPRAMSRMAQASSDTLADMYGVPREAMAQTIATMSPDQCSPAMAYLAHRSCSLTGEVLQVGRDEVARLAFVEARGFSKSGMTPEDVEANLDAILDIADAAVIPSTAPSAAR